MTLKRVVIGEDGKRDIIENIKGSPSLPRMLLGIDDVGEGENTRCITGEENHNLVFNSGLYLETGNINFSYFSKCHEVLIPTANLGKKHSEKAYSIEEEIFIKGLRASVGSEFCADSTELITRHPQVDIKFICGLKSYDFFSNLVIYKKNVIFSSLLNEYESFIVPVKPFDLGVLSVKHGMDRHSIGMYIRASKVRKINL